MRRPQGRKAKSCCDIASIFGNKLYECRRKLIWSLMPKTEWSTFCLEILTTKLDYIWDENKKRLNAENDFSPLEMVVTLAVKLLNDQINFLSLWQICSHICQILKIVELVQSIVAMLQIILLSGFASQGISIRILQCLDGARTHPKYPLGTA